MIWRNGLLLTGCSVTDDRSFGEPRSESGAAPPGGQGGGIHIPIPAGAGGDEFEVLSRDIRSHVVDEVTVRCCDVYRIRQVADQGGSVAA